jgi:hypothetical protein
MTATNTRPPALADQLTAPLTVTDPDVVGALCVFPLITDRGPKLDYVAFAEGRRRGVQIKELATAAEVGDLVVHNPLELPVLFYEVEEVQGAQQNRTVDVSVLVSAHSTLRVPVSCVEEARWEDHRHAEPFAPAAQAPHPELRRLKNERVRERLAAGDEPRADQDEVWQEIAAKSARHGARSRTGALRDVFEHRRDMLDDTRREIEVKCGQVGMLAAIAGRFVVLDYVSDVDAFAALHGPLVAGYALDALEHESPDAAVPPSLDDARDFLSLLLDAPAQPTAAVGLGTGLRFDHGGLAGTALAAERELVTITAFAGTARPRAR